MFMNKIFVNIFVPELDRNFNVELPINLEMHYVMDKLQKTIQELSEGVYEINKFVRLFDKNTGCIINLNNIVRYSGLKNGCSVLLI